MLMLIGLERYFKTLANLAEVVKVLIEHFI
jgi:hypothetical protein